jgi:hypothetical protein
VRITGLEVHILRAPDKGRPHWVSHFIVPKANEILVRLQTDEGLEGIGIASWSSARTRSLPRSSIASSFRSPGSGWRTRKAGRAKRSSASRPRSTSPAGT